MTAKKRAFVKNSYKRDQSKSGFNSLSNFYGGHFSDGGEVEGMDYDASEPAVCRNMGNCKVVCHNRRVT